MKKLALLLALMWILVGCALVKTTRCAEITGWGLNAMEPMTGTFLQLGYLNYKRVAAPETYTGPVNCPGYAAPATPPKATVR